MRWERLNETLFLQKFLRIQKNSGFLCFYRLRLLHEKTTRLYVSFYVVRSIRNIMGIKRIRLQHIRSHSKYGPLTSNNFLCVVRSMIASITDRVSTKAINNVLRLFHDSARYSLFSERSFYPSTWVFGPQSISSSNYLCALLKKSSKCSTTGIPTQDMWGVLPEIWHGLPL